MKMNNIEGLVVTDDGSRALIANTVDSTVSVIDTTTQRLVWSIKVGAGAGGITFRSAENSVRQP